MQPSALNAFVYGGPLFQCSRRQRARAPRCSASARDELYSRVLGASAAALVAFSWPSEVNAKIAQLSSIPAGSRIADLERVLTSGEESRLDAALANLESENGIRVRLLSQGEGNAPGVAVRQFFGLDDQTVLVVVDVRSGNILNFRVGDNVQKILPTSFWVELGNRFGNKFYVRDHGIDVAVLDTIKAIAECSRPGRAICNAVPGVTQDQLMICVASAATAGVIAGAATRTGGKKFNVPFFLLYSPIWSIFLVSFGIGPVLSRAGFVSGEAAAVLGTFMVCAAAFWWWVPIVLGRPKNVSDKNI